MKKLLKRLTVIAVIAVTVLGVLAFAACGETKSEVAGTYTVKFSKSELTGNIRHTGYITNSDCLETNTLVLKDDMTYEYTKYITTDVASQASLLNASREAADENVLFSWTSAGDGNCTLDFYKDGTYKFVFKSMSMTEKGTWKWAGWKMTLTKSDDSVVEIPMDADTHAFNFRYVAVAGGGQLTHDFTCPSSVWGAALGQTGSYTPVEGGGSGDDEPTPPPTTYSGPVKISYKFTGTYTAEGKTVTLSAATGCVWSEDWGGFQNHGFTNVSGTEKDMVFPKGPTGESYHPLNHFGGKYYFASRDESVVNNNPFKVTVKDDGTFEYIEESAFD